MAFIDAYNNIKKTLKTAKADKIDGHLAIQLNLTDDDASGIMYLEVCENKLNIEPYDYYDKDAMIVVSSKDFIDIMTSKLDFDKALEEGTLSIYGNLDKAMLIKTLIKKPATRKPAAKKSTASAAKKTAATKSTKKPAAKKTAEK